METKDALAETARALAQGYGEAGIPLYESGRRLPQRQAVIAVLRDVQKLLFPAFYGEKELLRLPGEAYAALLLARIREGLTAQLELAMAEGEQARAREVCGEVIARLPALQRLVHRDLQAAFDGDPAAASMEEVILAYPGLFAVFIYRVAHELFVRDVPMIPRIMTEFAHSQTGIDIHPGAEIGAHFFIDHGTGVVVGETAVIGERARIYQGVTLGALSPAGMRRGGARRHPKVGSGVTLYANATLLGGETEIGDGSVIGGNAFLTGGVAPGTVVSIKKPEMIFRGQ